MGVRVVSVPADRGGSAARAAAIGGIIGPAVFVAAWAAVGASRPGYSPVHDAISRLAAVGAPRRGWMTAGFATFGVAVPAYSVALRRSVSGVAALTAAATGVATLLVGLLPLDRSAAVDRWHAVAAVAGYVTLAATPLLAAAPLGARAGNRWRRGSQVAGVTAAVLLGASVAGIATGLTQRTGLLAGDLWVAASAGWMLRHS